MVANLHRGFVTYQSDGIFLSFLYHTRTLTRPSRRYKSLPLPLSCLPAYFLSRRLHQSRPALSNSSERNSAFLGSGSGSTCNSHDSPSQDTRQPGSGLDSNNEQDWDLLSGALGSLRSSLEGDKNDASPETSTVPKDHAQEKKSSVSRPATNDIFAGMMSISPELAADNVRAREAVELEGSSTVRKVSHRHEFNGRERQTKRIPRSQVMLDTPPSFRNKYEEEEDIPMDFSVSNYSWDNEGSGLSADSKSGRKTGMSKNNKKEHLGVQAGEEDTFQKPIHVPFDKEQGASGLKDNSQNWGEIDAPYRKIEKEQTLRYHAKVYNFSDRDENDTTSGLSAFGAGKLAKEAASQAIKQITAELDAVVSSGKGDIGIWELCEKRIFAMLKLFASEDEVISSIMPQDEAMAQLSGSNNESVLQSPHMEIKTGLEVARPQSNDPLNIPPGIPPKPFVLHAFPVTLHHALRLLHTHHPLSEITIQMHSAIKSRGRIAQLLASDTAVYHELLSYHWHVHNDLATINILLREMEIAGTSVSSEIRDLLSKIHTQKKEELSRNLITKSGRARKAKFASAPAYRAYKDFIGTVGVKQGWYYRIKSISHFDASKWQKTERMVKKLPKDLQSSTKPWKDLPLRSKNFMPNVDEDPEVD